MGRETQAMTRVPWLRLFTEGVVVVASILLAFGIDTYWSERKEANEEREVLIDLRDDFEDLRVRLSQWAAYNETGVRLLDLLLSDSLATVDRASADSALVLGMVTNVLDQGGPLEALFASGRLELIRSHEIRKRLGKWPDWLEDIHTNDLSRREDAMMNLVPLLTAHGWPDFDLWNCGSPPCAPAGDLPPSYLAMAGKPRLRAMLYLRKAYMGAARDDHADRISEVDQLLRLIGEELAARWP